MSKQLEKIDNYSERQVKLAKVWNKEAKEDIIIWVFDIHA